jgi:tetratricopeptide (TPR) repeat protein
MIRSVWLFAAFVAFSGAMLSQSQAGQAPKQDPKKATPKAQDKKQTKPPEPKKAPEPKPQTPPPVAPAEPERPVVDTTKPVNPLDLVRGLRENDQADLALEYIRVLETKALPPDVAAALPLEAALTRLESAVGETEDTKREGLIARARRDFEQFLSGNRNHPRSAEASVALARATSFQARDMLRRALKQPAAGDKDRIAARQSRAVFDEAAAKFAAATKHLAEQLAAGTVSPAQRYVLTRELHQAQLDRGINFFEQSRSYIRPAGPAEITARSEALKLARSAFRDVADRDPNHPFTWIARAWETECEFAMQNTTDAEKLIETIRNEAARYPAAREGIRMTRYFEVVHKYQSARSAGELSAARNLAERWLADYRTPKATREQAAVQYYIAFLRKEEAIATGVKVVKDGAASKIESISPSAVQQLRTAEREYRKLLERETDYSDRAAADRTQVIRYLIGDKPKPAAEYATFDEAHMAALVAMSDALRDGTLSAVDRAGKMRSAAGYLERAVAVAGPGDTPKDVLDARVQLTYAYLQGGDPHRAAVLGEHLARTARNPAAASRAGVIAVQGYLSSSPPVAGADDDARQAALATDRQRAIALSTELERSFPNEPATDAVRAMLGTLLFRVGQYEEAFRVLSRVTPTFAGLASARLTEGAAAFYVLRPETRSGRTAAEKKQIYERAVADLQSVPDPSPTAPAADARAYLWCRQQLVELFLLDSPDGLSKAISESRELESRIATYSNLPEEARAIHAFEAERLRLAALAAQAAPHFNAGRWKDLTDLLDPALAVMAKDVKANGTAVKRADAAKAKPGADPALANELAAAAAKLDQFRRDRIVLLALQGKIRGGDAGKTGELISLMETLGGSLDAHAAMLGQLLSGVRTQVQRLRNEGKSEEADRLTNAVGDLFVAFAAKPNLPDRHVYFAGKALNELLLADKAVPILAKLPEASEADLRAPFAGLSDEKKTAVRMHRSVKLELARAYRRSNQFDQAETILKAALGADEMSPGWAAKVLDYRKEWIYLIEAKAAAEPDPQKMNATLALANREWGKLGREYYSVLVQPLPNDAEKRNEIARMKDQIKPIYFGLIADNQRCLVAANGMILKDKPDVLAKRYDTIVAGILTIEKQNPDLAPEVREKFTALLDATPALRKKYAEAGGTMFVRGSDDSSQ